MITPLFRLTQDNEYLYVSLVVPNMRLNEAELFYEGDTFVFHATPYYLRLEGLSGRVQPSERIEVENEQQQTTQNLTPKKEITFDAEKGELLVPMAKETAGEHFDGLEGVGRFLSGPKTKPGRRLVEVLEGGDGQPEVEKEFEEEDFDWNIEQTLPAEEGVGSLLGREPYGFANRHNGVLERLGDDLVDELVDIRKPGLKSRAQRREERLAQETTDFSEDHYIADLYDEEEVIGEIIKGQGPWIKWSESEESNILSDENRHRLIESIPKRPFLKYDQATTRVLLLGLADLLYAYAYDMRVTDWEHCSESAWTIRKLSPTLSWLEFWTTSGSEDSRELKVESRQTVLASCIRRSLIYPIYRSWKLSLKVAQDVVAILGAGQAAVLKCLLDMHRLFNSEGDNLYVLNDLYIGEYVGWVQQLPKGGGRILRSLSADLQEVLGTNVSQGLVNRRRRQLSKADVHLDLELIERAAEIAWAKAQKEGKESGELSQRLERSVRLGEDELDSDDDEQPQHL